MKVFLIILGFINFVSAQDCREFTSRNEKNEIIGYACAATDFRIDTPNTDFRCNQHHGVNFGVNSNISHLKFTADNVINFFPCEIEKSFPKIDSITMKNASLLVITEQDLMYMPELIYINLESNLLQVLPEMLFSLNKKLKSVILRDNKFVFIHWTVLDNLKNFKKIDLGHQNCDLLGRNFSQLVERQQLKDSSCLSETRAESLENADDSFCYVSFIFNGIQLVILFVGAVIFVNFKRTSMNQQQQQQPLTTIELNYNKVIDAEPIYEDIYEEPVNTMRR
jgi:hypothetical protein